MQLHTESFELSARTNLEHAVAMLEQLAATEPPGKLPRIKHENAAATIRELLQLDDGAYFGRAS